jgi:glycogen operon protein
MLLGGDEIRRTQAGNNNAFCQDSPISWYDWGRAVSHAETLRFFQKMIDFRARHPTLRREDYFAEATNARGLPDIAWHGAILLEPGWDDPRSGVLSFTLGDPGDGEDIHVILNMESGAVPFQLPPVPGRRWYRAVDTALASPDDIADAGGEVLITTEEYLATSHSVVVLVSKDPAIVAASMPEERAAAENSETAALRPSGRNARTSRRRAGRGPVGARARGSRASGAGR